MKRNDYLWDGTGEPDAEVRRLEEVLGVLRAPEELKQPRRAARIGLWAMAASVLMAALVSQLMLVTPPATEWRTEGGELYAGQVVRASAGAVRLDAEAVGRVELEQGSEMALVESRPGRQRMDLREGTLRALIWAPAREFVVETPAARAIDLGCAYTMKVDRKGDGELKVTTGWVAFEHAGVESFIPAGAECRTRRLSGPGTPYFEDAPAELVAAVRAFDGGREEAIAEVLGAARARDALTLWHLLSRVPERRRGEVFQAFSRLVSVPDSVTEESVRKLEAAAMDACWNALGLESAGWYRSWRRQW